MKTKWYCMIGLALVVCLGLATQSPAAKGGIPGAPGGEDPPPDPEPELPFTYQRVEIFPEKAVVETFSINDFGVVAGEFNETGNSSSENRAMVAHPSITPTGVTYPSDAVEVLPFEYSYLYMINNLNQKVGYRVLHESMLKATVWLEDNTEIDLRVVPDDMYSMSLANNDAGMVVVRTWEPEGVFSGLVWPVDTDSDGEADTWFLDDDGDGINDLYLPLDYEGHGPVAINASGQVLFDHCLLTPDYADADGDGNPWYADEDGDGANDLLVFLSPLPGYAETYTEAFDMNDQGQIVGTSNGRAVRWDDPASPVDLGQPTKHSNEIKATHINNADQIVGWCREKRQEQSYFLIHEGQMLDLLELGATYPADMNNDGWLIDGSRSVYIPVYPEP